ncbi:MAG: hypothetical protein D6780_04630 [Candidatus Dadabacteria bacterium]|nr:MAG: hypothetical protein D6780_04630 [Candidatus Dadabacteria bacterium]
MINTAIVRNSLRDPNSDSGGGGPRVSPSERADAIVGLLNNRVSSAERVGEDKVVVRIASDRVSNGGVTFSFNVNKDNLQTEIEKVVNGDLFHPDGVTINHEGEAFKALLRLADEFHRLENIVIQATNSSRPDLSGIRVTGKPTTGGATTPVIKNVVFSGVRLNEMDISGAMVSNFTMTDCEAEYLQAKGIQVVDTGKKETVGEHTFGQSNFSRSILNYADFQGSHLGRASFRKTHLIFANLRGATTSVVEDMRAQGLGNEKLKKALIKQFKEAVLTDTSFDKQEAFFKAIESVANFITYEEALRILTTRDFSNIGGYLEQYASVYPEVQISIVRLADVISSDESSESIEGNGIKIKKGEDEVILAPPQGDGGYAYFLLDDDDKWTKYEVVPKIPEEIPEHIADRGLNKSGRSIFEAELLAKKFIQGTLSKEGLKEKLESGGGASPIVATTGEDQNRRGPGSRGQNGGSSGGGPAETPTPDSASSRAQNQGPSDENDQHPKPPGQGGSGGTSGVIEEQQETPQEGGGPSAQAASGGTPGAESRLRAEQSADTSRSEGGDGQEEEPGTPVQPEVVQGDESRHIDLSGVTFPPRPEEGTPGWLIIDLTEGEGSEIAYHHGKEASNTLIRGRNFKGKLTITNSKTPPPRRRSQS